MATPAPDTAPFHLIGGAQAVRRLVDRFYDLMDEEARFRELRSLHAPDLGPMRDSLSGFLAAWLGGPPDWFRHNPGKCVMSLHGRLPITMTLSQQWTQAMAQALRDTGVEDRLADTINQAFARMAGGMAREPKGPSADADAALER